MQLGSLNTIVMQLGSLVGSGQTSFYCGANQCSAEEGRELKRGWLSSHNSCISQEDGDGED